MAGEQLRVIEGSEHGKPLSVESELLIGRTAPGEAGRLGGDPEISRVHARISRGDDGRLTVADLGSANGTYVNGARIEAPRALDLGDLIRVGKTVLQVTDSSGAVPDKTQAAVSAPTDVAAEPSPQLIITAATGEERRLELGDELVIGRGVSGDGRLSDDPEVSRRHARIAREASGRWTIEDLGSANGTLLNGERLRGRQALAAGDRIRIGMTSMQLTGGGTSPAAAPPPAPAQAAPRAEARPPAARAAVPPRAKPAAPRSVLPLGSVFAGCRIEEVIGHGDMGVVYQAEELALRRPVALKVIAADYSREERFRERFRRESKIAAAIDHQNVIPIFDAGEEDGVMFITMRLVEGTDLRALIAQQEHLEPLRTARIVRQVAAALDAAHARGMLHRDVKPSNVLIARGDHAYLGDFGLAKQATAPAGLTRQGSIIARVEYVAPEQILNQPVDARADIYALGCLLFEALTGEAPFARWEGGPQPLAHVEAPVPSAVALRPDLPVRVDDVLARAMAKDPDQRYPSAGDLGEAALVAVGGLRRARPLSMVATGEAAFLGPTPAAAASPEPAAVTGALLPADSERPGSLRWAIALGALALMAAAMVAATIGISSL